MHAVLIALSCCLAGETPDTVVVVPSALKDALKPWLAHRKQQGHRIKLVDGQLSPRQIRAEIRKVAAGGALRAVMLVGDADPRGESDDEVRRLTVPTHRARAKVNVRWGSEPQIAADNWYADLDDDQVPDIAIGRLTADSREELNRIVRKIIAYETAPPPGFWRRRVNIVAGVGGFGQLADSVIETATKKFLTEGIPASYETSMTYGSWQSPFCPDPRQFARTTRDRLNEGSLFWVYIGHGQRRYLDRVMTPGGAFHIFDIDDVETLRRQGGPPIAIFLACYTGAFDERRDCIAEELLHSEHGPVAVYSGSRVTMPYAMAVMGTELMKAYFVQARETLGDVILHAKRNMVARVDPDKQDRNRQLLDGIAAAISPDPDLLDEERLEHLQLFNLLGDPLLRLHRSAKLDVETAEEVYAGQQLELSGTAPFAGQLTVEIVCRRDRLRFRPPRRVQFVRTDMALADYSDIYARANNRVWTSEQVATDAGPFRHTVDIPDDARGPCFARLHLQGKDADAVGAAAVFIRRPRQK